MTCSTQEFQGSFLNCIKLANGSAKELLKLIVEYFPAYRDEVIFLDRKGKDRKNFTV